MFNSYLENTLQFHEEKCIHCKRCTEVCPHGVFTHAGGKVKCTGPTRCMECGACALNCPVQAIEVESGVGCAWAMISAALRGRDMDSGECGCGGGAGSCCGGGTEGLSCEK